ncbi:Uncharacterised protein [Mycobacterium tuberculosis]|nr:Uncharacterised protein [Mycobacterium tuberculosis]
MSSASDTDLPRTRSITRRAFLGDTRTNRALATAEGYSVALVAAVIAACSFGRL